MVCSQSCRGNDLENDVGVSSAEECLSLCDSSPECAYANHYGDTSVCALLRDCSGISECADCTLVSKQICAGADGGGGDGDDNDVLVVITGRAA